MTFMDEHQDIFGVALKSHRAGKLDEAERLYRQVLRRDPCHADSLHLLGIIGYQAGDHDAATQLIERAISVNGANPIYYSNYAAALLSSDRVEDAIRSCRRAVELQPAHVPARYNLANALDVSGDKAGAESAYLQTIELEPTHPQALTNLGNLLLGRGDLEGAFARFTAAAEGNPLYAEAQYNLGNALSTAGKPDSAINYLQQAIALNPEYAEAHNNLGNIYRSRDQIDRAFECFSTACRLKPKYAIAHNNTASVLQTQGFLQEALAEYRAALQITPHDTATHSNLLVAENYSIENTPELLYEKHRTWAGLHAVPRTPLYRQSPSEPGQRLRIGYTSADFRMHPVAYFFLPLVSQHTRADFEVTCYSDVARPDRITSQLQELSDRWCDVRGWSDERLAATIAEDRIDILVDLAGHTANNRLCAFAAKPAPVQVSFLGYPNTTGMDCIDYRLTDAIVDPPEEEALFTEELIRLPSPFCCYAPSDTAPPIGPPPADQRGCVTFGSLHTPAKLNSRVIDVWSEILRGVPTSRLLIARSTLTRLSIERIAGKFLARGISSDRVEIRQLAARAGNYLDVYNEIDIVLDTFPWCGHTTTCEALWMGVPVVTLRGDRHAGRMGASLLTHAGLEALIGDSEASYVHCAVALADKPLIVRNIRRSLRDRIRNSALCNAAAYTAAVESAYDEMWRRWCTSQDQKSTLTRAG